MKENNIAWDAGCIHGTFTIRSSHYSYCIWQHSDEWFKHFIFEIVINIQLCISIIFEVLRRCITMNKKSLFFKWYLVSHLKIYLDMNINQNKWVSTSPSRTVWTGKFLCLKIKKNRFIWHNTFYRLNLYSSHVLQILNVSIIKGTWMILIKSGSCHIVLVCIESLVVYLYEIITKVCIPLQRLNESILFYFKYSITSQLKVV